MKLIRILRPGNKKSEGDVFILTGILLFFVLMAVFLPEVQDALGVEKASNDMTSLNENLKESQLTENTNWFSQIIAGTLVFGTFLFNVIKMATFTWGMIPLMIDLTVMMLIRAVFWVLIFRMVRGN